MKVLKYLLYLLVGLVAIAAVLGLIAKKDHHVERTVTIDAPRAAVYDKVNKHRNFITWDPWSKRDPNIKQTFEGTDGTVGATYNWEGNKQVGKGYMKILATSPDRIEHELYFDGQGTSPVYYNLKEVGDKTELTWGMDMHIPFPFNAMTMFSDMDKAIGTDFEEGLGSLKIVCEAEYASINALGKKIIESEIPSRVYAGIKQTVSMSEMSEFLGTSYAQLMPLAEKMLAGAPSALYFTWDEEKGETEMAAALPLSQKANFGDPLIDYWIFGGKALSIDYYGSFEGSVNAHLAMDTYLKANGITAKMPCIEEYITDPTTEPDTSKWLTRVIYFVEG